MWTFVLNRSIAYSCNVSCICRYRVNDDSCDTVHCKVVLFSLVYCHFVALNIKLIRLQLFDRKTGETKDSISGQVEQYDKKACVVFLPGSTPCNVEGTLLKDSGNVVVESRWG